MDLRIGGEPRLARRVASLGRLALLLAAGSCAVAGPPAGPPPATDRPPADDPAMAPGTPPPPWSAPALRLAQVPPPLVAAWRAAENRATCAPIAPASLGAGAGATARAAHFSGGWGLAFDLPGQRSAFGVAGTGVAAAEPAFDEWPFSMRWSDGSSAGYGPEGGTGPNQLAYLRITGQDCLYNVWSRLGREHLEHLLAELRLVAADETSGDPLVVLVHGLGRTSISMLPLEWRLEREGYEVLNWGYSSTCCGIDELAEDLVRAVSAHGGGDRTVHFVGHSLGGIIVRRALADETVPFAAGRVVMLAPPNRGSRAADRLAGALGWLLRPLPELRTDALTEARVPPVPDEVEIGVIAGRYDWKVSVDETRLPGMDAHIIVQATHTFLMLRPDVHRLILDYLGRGAFEADA